MKGASGTFALKVAGTGLSFVISVLLARLLGARGYGTYTYALAWIGLLSVPAIMGLDKLLIREVAAYQVRSARGLTRGLLRRSNQAVLLISLLIALGAAIVSWFLIDLTNNFQLLLAFWISLLLLPLTALTRIRQAAMQGLRYVVSAQVPEMLLRPVLFIALIGGAYLLIGSRLNAPWIMALQAAAAGVAFLVGAVLLGRALPATVKTAPPDYKTKYWFYSALPLLLVGGMQVINAQTDMVMLGSIKGVEAAGVYRVATRGADLIAFVLVSVNTALAPTIATLYTAGEMQRLQRIVTRSTRVVFLLSLPLALGLIAFGNWFLLIFGQGFLQGDIALTVLSVGQLFNASMGSVGILLIMTGYERDAAMGVGVSALLNVALNALLIPPLGLEGAAVATATSIIVWNLLLAIWVYRRLGIHTTALGKIDLRRQP